MRQEMIKLNRIRIAYSEEDMERLAADGYEPVPDGKSPRGGTGADNRQGAGRPDGAGTTEGSAEAAPSAEKPEKTVKAVKSPKKSKGSKKPAAEKNPEDAGTDREPEAAEGEDQDAG